MKLTITATDKPKEQEFHYELEISNKQVHNDHLHYSHHLFSHLDQSIL